MLKTAIASTLLAAMITSAQAAPVGIPGAFVGEVGGGELRMPAGL